MKCPHCGTEMENGFIGIKMSAGIFWGLYWHKEHKVWGLGGEPLGKLASDLPFKAQRCVTCRTFVVDY